MFGGAVDHDEHVQPVGRVVAGVGEQLGGALDGGADGQLAFDATVEVAACVPTREPEPGACWAAALRRAVLVALAAAPGSVSPLVVGYGLPSWWMGSVPVMRVPNARMAIRLLAVACGLAERCDDPELGERYRITDAGREALRAAGMPASSAESAGRLC